MESVHRVGMEQALQERAEVAGWVVGSDFWLRWEQWPPPQPTWPAYRARLVLAGLTRALTGQGLDIPGRLVAAVLAAESGRLGEAQRHLAVLEAHQWRDECVRQVRRWAEQHFPIPVEESS